MPFWSFYIFYSFEELFIKSWRPIHYEFSTKKIDIFRIIRPEVFYKTDNLKLFLKFTGKHLYWKLFFNKISSLAYNFITKRLQHRCEIFKNIYFVEHLRMAASGFWLGFMSVFKNASEINFWQNIKSNSKKGNFFAIKLEPLPTYFQYND